MKRVQSQSHLHLQLDPCTTYTIPRFSNDIPADLNTTHFFTRVLYTVYAPFVWGGALGEFDAFVHSSAGPLKSETLDELADWPLQVAEVISGLLGWRSGLQVFNPKGRAPNLTVIAGLDSLKQARYLRRPLERGKLGDEAVAWEERRV
jgi:hypothetical protein